MEIIHGDADFFLDKYKVAENEAKIVFEFSNDVLIDLYANRDFLHRIYREVEIEWTADRPRIQTVICYKRSTPKALYDNSYKD